MKHRFRAVRVRDDYEGLGHLPSRPSRAALRRGRRESRRHARQAVEQLKREFPGAKVRIYWSPAGEYAVALALMRLPHQPGRLGVVARVCPPCKSPTMATVEILARYLSPIPPKIVTAITATGRARSVAMVPAQGDEVLA